MAIWNCVAVGIFSVMLFALLSVLDAQVKQLRASARETPTPAPTPTPSPEPPTTAPPVPAPTTTEPSAPTPMPEPTPAPKSRRLRRRRQHLHPRRSRRQRQRRRVHRPRPCPVGQRPGMARLLLRVVGGHSYPRDVVPPCVGHLWCGIGTACVTRRAHVRSGPCVLLGIGRGRRIQPLCVPLRYLGGLAAEAAPLASGSPIQHRCFWRRHAR
mmetsp:Transcript_19349/g.55473  ORF Transcript_19349/g.55473 Transcript_19349/m.55473 type:complete len:212 (+) Transcript_19349:176-811(+)